MGRSNAGYIGNRSGSPVQVHRLRVHAVRLWRNLKYKARFKNGPGLYFESDSSEKREEKETREASTDLPWAAVPPARQPAESLDPNPRPSCAV